MVCRVSRSSPAQNSSSRTTPNVSLCKDSPSGRHADKLADFQGSLAGAGELGQWGCERGLTFYQTQLAGHEVPEYAPGVGYRSLEILLGRVKDFSTKSDFSTQKGNFGN